MKEKKQLTYEEQKEKLKRKYKSLKIAYRACTTAFAVSAVVALSSIVLGQVHFDMGKRVEYDTYNNLKESVGVEFDEYRLEETRKLYEKLECGEITVSEFGEQYKYVEDDYKIIEWARNLDDEQVKNVIANYDKKMSDLQKKENNSLRGLLWGMAGVLGLGFTSIGIDNKRNSAEADFRYHLNDAVTIKEKDEDDLEIKPVEYSSIGYDKESDGRDM